ncbi:MAG: DUF480 domain-containing protein, partial [Verrucomicrobiota bacterium]
PEVEEALNALSARQPSPLVAKLPRAPGTKESRYAHLLSGPVEFTAPERVLPVEPAVAQVRAENDRIAALEQQVTDLRHELGELQQQFASFRKQFE